MDALWRALDSVCEDWPTQLTENVVSWVVMSIRGIKKDK
jgi:hypothetical protein